MSLYLEWSPTAIENAGGNSWNISSDGFTLTMTGGGEVWGLATNPLSAGSYYCEITIVSLGSGNNSIGIGGAYTPDAITGVVSISPNGEIYLGHSGGYSDTGINIGAFSAGDIIQIAVALPNLLWLARNGGNYNNSSSANPAIGTGGINISSLGIPLAPCVGAPDGISGGTGVFVLNAGHTAFSYSMPALFEAWPAPEAIILNAIASVSYGNPLSISGTTTNGVASTLQYSYNDGQTWSNVGSYSGGATWTGLGPTFPGNAFGALEVRDGSNTGAVSNSETFVVTGPAYHGSQLQASASWNLFTNYTGSPNWNDGTNSIDLGFTSLNSTDGYHFSSAANHLEFQNNPGTLALGINAFIFTMTYEFTITESYGIFVLGAGSANLDGIGCYQVILGSGGENNNSSIIDPDSNTVTFTTNRNGFLEFDFFQNLTTGQISCEVFYNGSSVALVGPSNASGFGNYATQGIFFAYSVPSTSAAQRDGMGNPLLTIGFSAYDNASVAETLTILTAEGSIGLCSLSGSNTGNIAEALDYRLDNGVDYASNPVWNPLPKFTSGSNWTGSFPIYTPGVHTVVVRDDAATSVVSNLETFVVPNGIFVWNNVKIR